MRLAVVAAGFTPGEADQLRRAMGAWRRPGIIDQFRRKLIDGMLAQGIFAGICRGRVRTDSRLRRLRVSRIARRQLRPAGLCLGLAEAPLPRGVRRGLLNSQPMGFYAPAQLVRDAREHGVTVLPVDVNYSDWECTLEGGEQRGGEGERGEESEGEKGRGGEGEICRVEHRRRRLPSPPLPLLLSPLPLCPSLSLPPPRLQHPAGHGVGHGERIEEARRAGPFASVDDFARRTGLGQAAISRLAKAGALASLEADRRAALWDALRPRTARNCRCSRGRKIANLKLQI